MDYISKVAGGDKSERRENCFLFKRAKKTCQESWAEEESVLERSLMAVQSKHAQTSSISMITSANGLGSRFFINENP